MNAEKGNVYRKLAQHFVAALICQTRLSVTLLVYAVLAVLLLAYVSSHVFASMLGQDIAQLQALRQQRKEAYNKLTAEYVSTSSRARVAKYCESVLGMVQAGDRSVERFALRAPAGREDDAVLFAGSPAKVPEGFTLLDKSDRTVE